MIDTRLGEGHMPVVGVVPERKRRVGGESLLVALRITEDGGLRVVPGITPSFIDALGPKAKDVVASSCVVGALKIKDTPCLVGKYGGLGRIRTGNRTGRSRPLFPVELQVQTLDFKRCKIAFVTACADRYR
jgi:hypothetical protein